MDSQWTAREIMKLVFRRKFLVAGITLALLFTAVTITFFLPRKYVSTSKLRVVDSGALHRMYGRKSQTEGNSADPAGQIIAGLHERETVSDVISRLGLDEQFEGLTEVEQRKGREALIDEIVSSTTVTLHDTPPGQLIFRIAVSFRDPAEAQRIATQLAVSYQLRQVAVRDETLDGTLTEVREATAGTRREYRTVAGELAAFETEHPDLAAQQNEPIDTLCEQQRGQLRAEADTLGVLEGRLAAIRAQLEDEPEWLTEEEASTGGGTPGEDGEGSSRVRNQTHFELSKSERQIATLLDKSKLKHQELKASLVLNERRREAIPLLVERWEKLREQQELLQQELTAKEEQEEIHVNSWLTEGAENALIFSLLDPPSYPMEPELPNQLVISVMGLVLGLGVGIGTVLTIDLLDDSIRSDREISGLLGLPVLGTIEKIETPAERIKARRTARAATVGIVALFFLTATALFVQVSSDGDVGSLMARVLELFG